MKKDLNNIEEIFKKAFDGFEGNVDPSVWNNIQNNIGGQSVAPNNISAVSTTKAVLSKIVLGVFVATGLATSVYFIAASKTNEPQVDAVTTKMLSENNQAQIIQPKEELVIENNKGDISIVETINDNSTSASQAQKLVSENKIQESQSVVKQENKTTTNVSKTEENLEEEIVQKTSNQQPKLSQNTEEIVGISVKIKASTVIGKMPLEVEFNVDGNAVAYSWDFGDGSEISSQENSFHTYTVPGKYTVRLTAIDKNANSKTAVQVITVEQNIKSHLSSVPTVFSPNSDGINDVVKVDGENIKSFNAVVRDVKGNLVYEWKTLEGFWDGRDMNNQVLPKGIYYIVVFAVGVDGETHTIKQSIQLF